MLLAGGSRNHISFIFGIVLSGFTVRLFMSIEQLYDIYLLHPSIQTDSRQLKPGDLFFALKGPSFNGNRFAVRALEMGAACAVIDETSGQVDLSTVPSDRLFVVPDVLRALQELALHHRRQFNIPFIAITGSNGKTTTKELVHAVLSSYYPTYTTQGNLNNHIGIPLTLLSVRPDAQFAVIEMGANHQKEIEDYCRYTLPTHGIITNVGRAHLEGFGGPEGVKKGKGELYDYLRGNGGTAFVWQDSDDLRKMSHGIPQRITYGTRNAEYSGQVIPNPESPFLSIDVSNGAATGSIYTQLVGDYNLSNVLAAVAVGKHFGVPDEQIRDAIEAYTPSNSRSQLIERGGNHIILDAYNANPSSMRAAIENFAAVPTGQSGNGSSSPFNGGKILILGAMAELGKESLKEHHDIIDLIRKYHWEEVVLVGGDFLTIPHGYLSFRNSREAGEWLRHAGLQDAYLLIKGSRSMKMEEVLNEEETDTQQS
jgi:UDP-N-acetylmuramoyl-tripeptide--D-alanyl-D-alanine ligase